MREFSPTARGLADLELLLDGGLGSAREMRLEFAAEVGERITLTDPEGVPLAEFAVTARDGEFVSGTVKRLRAAEFGPFRRLRRTAAEIREELGGKPAVAFVGPLPPTAAEIAELASSGERILLLPAVAASPLPAETLVKATLAAELPADTLVVPLPLSTMDNADVVARNYGATRIVLGRGTGDYSPAVSEVLRRNRRGVVVFLTGLSGSGKSTVARGVADALVESTDRTVTLLDGDVVRRLLSAGLTFSRADRDLNIARIGFVAAEVARHGGIALCAPIAPYAAARAEVRARAEQVGDFVLVHVATPLEVCEARDRKGLYAKARAGIIKEFTGISDPYETPEDAELTIDTSETSTEASVRTVLEFLAERGYIDG
jgi:sulfate adenylyltransferase